MLYDMRAAEFTGFASHVLYRQLRAVRPGTKSYSGYVGFTPKSPGYKVEVLV
jgi:hypothetical protein